MHAVGEPHACDQLWSPGARRLALTGLRRAGCVKTDARPRASSVDEPCPPYCADPCALTRPGPALCLCGGFACFDDAVRDAAVGTRDEDGWRVGPVLFWRRAEAFDAGGAFTWLRHKRDRDVPAVLA